MKGAIAMLILGIIIGLLSGVVLGLALSFPLGSAFGIFIERFSNGWAMEIELVLIILSALIIYKLFNVKWKNS